MNRKIGLLFQLPRVARWGLVIALGALSRVPTAFAQTAPNAPAPPEAPRAPDAPPAPSPPPASPPEAQPPAPAPAPALAPAPAPAATPGTSPDAASLPAGPEPITPTAAPHDELKAVVVTAQRREESAQDVPTPLTVLSGENLTESDIGRSAKEILDYVPNASAATQLHGRPRWWIRGVGTGQQQLDFSNPVGFYLDDVYISNATGTGFPLFDLDRVEVLRGPQGTLWGKNTTGGAINVITRKPEFSYDGYLKFDYGSFRDKQVQGAFGGPVWDGALAARGSFYYEDSQGRFRNLATGRRDGQFQDGAFRLQLLGKLSPKVEALGNVHLRKYSTLGGTSTVTGSGAGGAYLEGYVPSSDINHINSNAPQNEDIRQVGALITLNAELGKFALTSITGYEDFRNESLSDSDNTPLEFNRGWAHAVSYQWSEEIRLASPREDRWNWVAGLFLFSENIDRQSATGKLPGIETVVPGPANYSYTTFEHDTQSVAAFASSTLNVTDALSVSAGLRWTLERRELDITRLASASDADAEFSNVVQWWLPKSVSSPLAQTYSVNPDKTWKNFTYDITPQYQITKDAQVYARYAHGVKSGGFNTAATSLASLNVVEPEKLNDIEVGTKTRWLKGRLTVNANVFHYIYKDIQVNVVGPLPPTNTAVSYLQNVKRGRVDGAELEIDALPAENLHVGGSLGLLDTEFTDFKVLNGGPDYSGNSFVRSPHVTGLVRADYRIPLPFGKTPSLTVAADWRYQSRQFHFTTNQDDPLLQSSGFSLVNAHASLASNDEKVILSAYTNNLFDRKYRNHSLPAARNATGATAIWGDPRTFGVSLLTRWY